MIVVTKINNKDAKEYLDILPCGSLYFYNKAAARKILRLHIDNLKSFRCENVGNIKGSTFY